MKGTFMTHVENHSVKTENVFTSLVKRSILGLGNETIF